MSLVGNFRSKMEKTKDPRMKEAVFDVAYSTGFLALDYLNGTVVHVKDKDRDFKYNSVGIVDGCAVTCIGRTGCGKSTLIVQMAANIIRKFPGAAIFHDDLEGGSTGARRAILTRFTAEELQQRYVYRNTGVTAENLYQRIKTIHDEKISNPSEYEYDTGLFDTRGGRIFKFIPTVYIVDSLPMLMPEKVTEEEELTGQMTVTSGAKVNTRVIKSIVPMLKAANIILLSINHILDDVVINPMQRSKSQVAYLKPGERLPGGKAFIYLANNMFRLDDDQKLTDAKDYGVNGAIVNVTIVKSRTNKSGKSIPLVLDMETGFDPILSLFAFLKSVGRINDKGSYKSIGDSDIKFFQKDFKRKLMESPELQKVFADECNVELSKLLSTGDVEDMNDEALFDISDAIMTMDPNDQLTA